MGRTAPCFRSAHPIGPIVCKSWSRHRQRGSDCTACANGDRLRQWRMANFDPYRLTTTTTIIIIIIKRTIKAYNKADRPWTVNLSANTVSAIRNYLPKRIEDWGIWGGKLKFYGTTHPTVSLHRKWKSNTYQCRVRANDDETQKHVMKVMSCTPLTGREVRVSGLLAPL